jgi:hypothetical protein
VRDLDEDQRHDREEEEISAHHPTVSAGWPERNRPIGLNGAAEQHGSATREQLCERAEEGHQKKRDEPQSKHEFAGHCPQDAASARFLPGLQPDLRGTIVRTTERREARMYIGLGTVLLIVLILILLIWVF